MTKINIKVYVPRPGAFTLGGIAHRSAIVGTPQDNGQVLIDYEGNINESSNIITLGDRCVRAAGRHNWQGRRYPTIARFLALSDDLIEVGYWDGERVHVTQNSEALEAWIGSEATERELSRTA